MKKKVLSKNPEIVKREIASLTHKLNYEIWKCAKLRCQWECCFWFDEHGDFCIAKNDYPSRIANMGDIITQDRRTLIKLQEELKELRGEGKGEH